MDPASISAFPVKRLGGKGHIACAGDTRNSETKDTKRFRFRRPVRRECIMRMIWANLKCTDELNLTRDVLDAE